MFTGAVGNPQRVVVDAAHNATTTLLNATNGKAIVVTGLFVSTNAAGTMAFASNAVAVTGTMPIAANTVVSAQAPGGLFAGSVGNNLTVTTSASSNLQGVLTYVLANE